MSNVLAVKVRSPREWRRSESEDVERTRAIKDATDRLENHNQKESGVVRLFFETMWDHALELYNGNVRFVGNAPTPDLATTDAIVDTGVLGPAFLGLGQNQLVVDPDQGGIPRGGTLADRLQNGGVFIQDQDDLGMFSRVFNQSNVDPTIEYDDTDELDPLEPRPDSPPPAPESTPDPSPDPETNDFEVSDVPSADDLRIDTVQPPRPPWLGGLNYTVTFTTVGVDDLPELVEDLVKYVVDSMPFSTKQAVAAFSAVLAGFYIRGAGRRALADVDRWKQERDRLEKLVEDLTNEYNEWKTNVSAVEERGRVVSRRRMVVSIAIAEVLILQVAGPKAPILLLDLELQEELTSLKLQLGCRACTDRQIEWLTLGELVDIGVEICER